MDRPVLEKLILAKLPLPPDADRVIKKFLQVPTPTARLMNRVSVSHHDHVTVIESPDLRNYEQRGRWSNPPLLPEILISHGYGNRGDYSGVEGLPQRFAGWDSAGEPLGGRGYMNFVKLKWPAVFPSLAPHWTYDTPRTIDQMSRWARSRTPVSV